MPSLVSKGTNKTKWSMLEFLTYYTADLLTHLMLAQISLHYLRWSITSLLLKCQMIYKDRLKKAYQEDKYWQRILDVVKARPSSEPESARGASGGTHSGETPTPRPSLPPVDSETPGIQFSIRDGLIYYTCGDVRERLCIPAAIEGEVFRMAHDLANHGDFHRTYDRLSNSVYVRQMVKRLRLYIAHCPDCQVFKTVRHSPYGSLNPVVTLSIPFHTIAMDFVVDLPIVDGSNVLLTMMCKFTRKVALEPGKDTWGSEEWANVVVTALYKRDWGIPRSFLSDRDSKFMSSFWRAIFQKLGIKMLTSTAYHPQTDGQSERTNQTVEIALRYYLSRPDTNWVESLPYISAIMNNSINFTTGFAPNELLYGFKVNDNLGLLEDLPPEDYDRLRQIHRTPQMKLQPLQMRCLRGATIGSILLCILRKEATLTLSCTTGTRFPALRTGN